jgi:hypothetical protein
MKRPTKAAVRNGAEWVRVAGLRLSVGCDGFASLSMSLTAAQAKRLGLALLAASGLDLLQAREKALAECERLEAIGWRDIHDGSTGLPVASDAAACDVAHGVNLAAAAIRAVLMGKP